MSDTFLLLLGGGVDFSKVKRLLLPIAFAHRSTTMIGPLLCEVSLSCGVDLLCNRALVLSRHVLILIRLALALTLAFALTSGGFLGAHA